jgi:hypothetical protein
MFVSRIRIEMRRVGSVQVEWVITLDMTKTKEETSGVLRVQEETPMSLWYERTGLNFRA